MRTRLGAEGRVVKYALLLVLQWRRSRSRLSDEDDERLAAIRLCDKEIVVAEPVIKTTKTAHALARRGDRGQGENRNVAAETGRMSRPKAAPAGRQDHDLVRRGRPFVRRDRPCADDRRPLTTGRSVFERKQLSSSSNASRGTKRRPPTRADRSCAAVDQQIKPADGQAGQAATSASE